VLVPVIGIFIGRKCSGLIWFAVGITLAGLYLLCFAAFPKNGLLAMSGANLMLLLCALLFSVQILSIDHYAPTMSPVSLACVQFFVSGVFSFAMALFTEIIPDPAGWASALSVLSAWIPILYTGIFSCAVGYTLQAVGQRDLNPTLASLIMSMESVFSTIFGWLILGQTMTVRELWGCGLIFVAIILAQVPLPQNNKKNADI
jgi:drug/metabolite transporter (DMT)-like permease